jgi:hypothetical protein
MSHSLHPPWCYCRNIILWRLYLVWSHSLCFPLLSVSEVQILSTRSVRLCCTMGNVVLHSRPSHLCTPHAVAGNTRTVVRSSKCFWKWAIRTKDLQPPQDISVSNDLANHEHIEISRHCCLALAALCCLGLCVVCPKKLHSEQMRIHLRKTLTGNWN